MLMQNYAMMRVAGFIKQVVDEIGGQNRFPVIGRHFIHIFLFTLVLVVSLFLMRKLIISASRKIEFRLREKIFGKLLALDYLFFQKHDTGDIVSRCTNDLDDVRTLLGPGIMYVPNSLTRFIIFFPVLFQLSHSIILVITAVLLLLMTLIMVLIPRLRPLYRQLQEMDAKISTQGWQAISGISTIKLHNLEEIEGRRFGALNREYIKKNMSVVIRRDTLWPVFIFVFSLTEVIILLMGGRQVIAGQLTIGELFQFNIMIASLTFPILSFGWIMSLLQQGISAMGRINYILDHPEPTQTGLKDLEADRLVFEIKNLHYRYPGIEQEVLTGIDLTIEPGQTIGITGMVGSGKSTLLNIIGGLLKPGPGMVLINGQDIGDFSQSSLSQKISVVSQSPYLFSRTLAENIALGIDGEYDLESIDEAVYKAGLKDDVQAFPEKFSTIVGERGITLSGGQKQRTAIARALVRHTPVLLLDDPLSNVDSATEEQILHHLKTLNHYQTLIVVSHRMSVLKNADLILVMDQGTVVEQGNHFSLMKRKGLYARLARLQQMEVQLEKN